MDGEEFSAWCDKNLSEDSLDEDDDEGDESQRVGWDVGKILIHIYSLFRTSHCAK